MFVRIKRATENFSGQIETSLIISVFSITGHLGIFQKSSISQLFINIRQIFCAND